ncbi:MAG: hypothetical protein BA872_00210 [Desulfobacterales bacterium C00003060]|nr:MAG: hypothetical protein BA872_00210 [Desulfobacterales bacterium C00003060]
MKAANSCKLCAISDVDNIYNLLFLLAMTVTQNTREPEIRERIQKEPGWCGMARKNGQDATNPLCDQGIYEEGTGQKCVGGSEF